MAKTESTSITRRKVVAALTLAAAPGAFAGLNRAHAQDKQSSAEKSLYERPGWRLRHRGCGGSFQRRGREESGCCQKSKNPQLREWHTKNLKRLPGLKFMRTRWVCNISGGPFQFTATRPGKTPLGLEEAHRNLRIPPPRSSTRSQRSSDGHWISPRSRSARKPRSWQPLLLTKTRSQLATPRIAAEAFCSDDQRPPGIVSCR
jgi:hemoglobin